MKKLLSVLVFVLVLTFAFSAFADYQTVDIYVNGEFLVSDSPAVLVGSRTMVPLRAISEKLGCEVGWDPDTQTAEIKNSKTAVYVTIDSDVMVKKSLAEGKSEDIKIDAPAMLYKSRTLIPLRAVSEALDAKVDWDSERECALITTSSGIKTYYGEVTEQGYVSEVLGIRFEAPQNVEMSYDHEIIEVSEFTDDIGTVDAESAVEFSAINTVSGSNISFAASPKTSVTVSDYLEYVRNSVEGVVDGITYVSKQGTDKRTIAGYEFEKVGFTVSGKDLRLGMDYYASKIADRIVFMVVVYSEGDEKDAESIIGSFKANF